MCLCHSWFASRLVISAVVVIVFAGCVNSPRVPGHVWERYSDPSEAGWDTTALAAARDYAESIDSAAYILVHGGVVVDTYGDVSRRYMCHSVRKSFLSALYGMHVAKGTIDIDQTLEQLGVDDKQKLTHEEKQATLRHMLKARSGVYHPAAYETASMAKARPKRGSHAPDTFWYYNNWDFNTLMTILERETGTRIFEEFDQRIARPIGMEDFRVRDGYYHLEDHSKFPAYPFRMSARDMARFGLLFLNKGKWGTTRLIEESWVRASHESYSQPTRVLRKGYGYMWWLFGGELGAYEAYSALGVGGQTITIIPKSDMVFVNRTDTFVGDRVAMENMHRLIKMLIDAKTSDVASGGQPALVALTTPVSAFDAEPYPAIDVIKPYVGTYGYSDNRQVEVDIQAGRLVGHFPGGAYAMRPVGSGVFLLEDSLRFIQIENTVEGNRVLVITK